MGLLSDHWLKPMGHHCDLLLTQSYMYCSCDCCVDKTCCCTSNVILKVLYNIEVTQCPNTLILKIHSIS